MKRNSLLRLTGCGRFWQMRGYPAEGRRRLESALCADDAETLARSKALYNLSLLAFELGEIGWYSARGRALATARATGDSGELRTRASYLDRELSRTASSAAQDLFAASVHTFQ